MTSTTKTDSAIDYENPWLCEGSTFTSNDIGDFFGFVYRITNKVNGRIYIGRKYFYAFRTPKGKKRKQKQESDWKKYYGSCPELKEDIKKTDGGLMLAESHREDIRYRKGKVISTGTNVNGIEEGDCIWYDRHAGNNLEIDNTIFKVIEERDVIIVL